MYTTKKSYVKSLTVFGKFLYYTGCLKVEKSESKNGKEKYSNFKMRLIHPFSWIAIPIIIVVQGVNLETFEDIKDLITFI